MKPISVYNGVTRKRLAYLENAYNISYEQTANGLWTGGFSLPYSDPKNRYCQSFNLVELWDIDAGGNDLYVGLFRILPKTAVLDRSRSVTTYKIEHVLATLLDSTMIGWHQIGNIGVFTTDVINYILTRQNHVRWELDQCDYTHQFLYGWQDENLLSALFSVVKPFLEADYFWDFDTRVFPWKLRLRKTSTNPKTDIRYGKNIIGVTRTEDPSRLVTRLYCFGDNKLNIAGVNNGLMYLDSPNIALYGIIEHVWTDERFSNAISLKDVGSAILDRYDKPVVSYEIDIQTINAAANLRIGDTIRVVYDELNENMVVQKISKRDVSGAPLSGRIFIGEGTFDISEGMASLAQRQRIQETYAQGAESMFIDSFRDNADYETPMEVSFFLPPNVVHVNEIIFTVKLEKFRSSIKGLGVGGGGWSDQVSLRGDTFGTEIEYGGPQGWTSSDNYTSDTIFPIPPWWEPEVDGYEVNPAWVSLKMDHESAEWEYGNDELKTEYGFARFDDWGPLDWTTDKRVVWTNSVNIEGLAGAVGGVVATEDCIEWSGSLYRETEGPIDWVWSPGQWHSHLLRISHGHDFKIQQPQEHRHQMIEEHHRHDLNLEHSHRDSNHILHTHEFSWSTHNHSFTYEIPGHRHLSISINPHQHWRSSHHHSIQGGIYEGSQATEVAIYIDDMLVGIYGGSVNDVNLIPHMAKDANGNIFRGEHTIRIVPNGLTRIEGFYQVRIFTSATGQERY